MAEMSDEQSHDRAADGTDKSWVPLADAAAGLGCTEEWLLDRCRDGRLPSRPDPESGPVVPLSTARDLVEGRQSD